MVNFADMKKKRNSIQEKLTSEMEKQNTKKSYTDDRQWKLTRNEAGNGFATIRFLPPCAVDGNDALPWVRYWDHGFQGPGGWYIERSLTTLNGQPDPVSEANSKLWNTGIKANQDIARQRKRRINYVSNILVIDDPANPSNNGKVFLFEYGKKIFDKIQEAMIPPSEFEDETPCNVFDFWNGANFKLKARKVDGFVNYDKSEFEKPSALSEDDDVLKKIWESQYSLNELIDPKHFKSYEQLKERFERVTGQKVVSSKAEDTSGSTLEDEDTYVPTPSAGKTKKSAMEIADDDGAPFDTDDDIDGGEDEGETLDFYKKLIED